MANALQDVQQNRPEVLAAIAALLALWLVVDVARTAAGGA